MRTNLISTFLKLQNKKALFDCFLMAHMCKNYLIIARNNIYGTYVANYISLIA